MTIIFLLTLTIGFLAAACHALSRHDTKAYSLLIILAGMALFLISFAAGA